MKKICSLIIAFLFVLGSFSKVYALNMDYKNYIDNNYEKKHYITSQEEEKIEKLLNEIAKEKIIEINTNYDSNIKTSNFKKDKYEYDLKRLGIKELSASELKKLFPESNMYRSSDTVKWYEYNRIYPYKGKEYSLRTIIASGYNEGGMLVNALKNYTFYSGEELFCNTGTELLSIYIQKAMGTVPYLRWMPYELGFANGGNNKINTNTIDTINISHIKFSFVKEKAQSDDYYSLVKFSNKANIYIKTYGSGVVNGKIKHYNKETEFTAYSNSYSSDESAIKAYESSSILYDYMPHYSVYSYDKKYSKEIDLPNPLAGPGQIY